MGGKGKLLWLIHRLAPEFYKCFVDVFGGSGTVTMNHPIKPGCTEVYNDYNSNLSNLFCCVKNRPMPLLEELGFLPLHSRDEFNALYKFFSLEEFTDSYLAENLELTERYLEPVDAAAIRALLLERAERADVKRAAAYYKTIRESFSGAGNAFAGRPCDIRRFFYQIWECSRRLKDVVVENKDFENLIRQYDREDTFFYCDPPYYDAECYEVAFPKPDHVRLHDRLIQCQGKVMVSYNYCPFILDLYQDFFIFHTKRPNSMSMEAGSEYEEVVMTNYRPQPKAKRPSDQFSLFAEPVPEEPEGWYELIHEPKETTISKPADEEVCQDYMEESI